MQLKIYVAYENNFCKFFFENGSKDPTDQQRYYCLTTRDIEDKNKTFVPNHGLQYLSNYMK